MTSKRLKALEKENPQLKKLVANQTLDLSILTEVAKGAEWNETAKGAAPLPEGQHRRVLAIWQARSANDKPCCMGGGKGSKCRAGSASASGSGVSEGGTQRRRTERVNHVWSYDFVFDQTEDGRRLKWLPICDEFSRELVALEVERR
ncbi:MAG: hypothetical protein K8R23_14730, partial [Chthoniobacter sp.]|nr:hypothetical protein [Chthoniobacter sp.]